MSFSKTTSVYHTISNTLLLLYNNSGPHIKGNSKRTER